MNGDIERTHTTGPTSAYGPPVTPDSPLILVAEDDEDALDIVCTMFQHAGYRVAQASSGPEALTMARELHPALLVLDVAMPGMTGWEVARRLRADEEASVRTQRILVLTAHAFAEDRLRARELGCDGYLSKPADVRHVVHEARRILRGQPWPHTERDD